MQCNKALLWFMSILDRSKVKILMEFHGINKHPSCTCFVPIDAWSPQLTVSPSPH